VVYRNPFQPRSEDTIDENEIAELALSMQQDGLLHPITVQEVQAEAYILLAGLRRLRAAELLGWEAIDAIVSYGDPREIALIENLQRVDLHPIDLAECVAELVSEKGWTHEDAATSLGKARSTISELLSLSSRLSEKIKNEWRASGAGFKSQLIALTSLADPEEQYQLWSDIKEGRTLTVAETRARKAQNLSPSVPMVVKSGWRFVNKLKRLQADDWTLDRAHWDELVSVCRELNTYISGGARTSDALRPREAESAVIRAVPDIEPTS
jgi:ParB family chromosome partitioning protein